MCCVPTARRIASTKLNYATLLERVQREVDDLNDTAAYASKSDPDEEICETYEVNSSNKIADSAYSQVNDLRRGPDYASESADVAVDATGSGVVTEPPSLFKTLDGLSQENAESSSMQSAAKKRRKRIRKKLKPGLTAKNQERQFVKHNYHDHSNDDPEEYLKLDFIQQNSTYHQGDKVGEHQHHHPKLCGGPGNSGGVTVPFPFKLHTLLEQIEQDGFGHIVSWQPHGRAFVIHDKKTFVDQIMPNYFKQTKLTSFQRQLNLYGFTRLSRGTDAGGYYHELFLRNMPFLCHKMIRIKCKGTGFKAASDPDSEPNFYTLPYVCHPKDYWKDAISKLEKKILTEDEDSAHHTNIVSCGGSSHDLKRPASPCLSEDDDLFAAFLKMQEKKQASMSPAVFSNFVDLPLSNTQFPGHVMHPSMDFGASQYARNVPISIDCLLEDDNSEIWQKYPISPKGEESMNIINSVPSFEVPYRQQDAPPAYDYSSVLDHVPMLGSLITSDPNKATSFEYDWVGFGNTLAPNFESLDSRDSSWNVMCPSFPASTRYPCSLDRISNSSNQSSGDENEDDDLIFNKILDGASNMMTEIQETLLDTEEDLGHFLEMLVD